MSGKIVAVTVFAFMCIFLFLPLAIVASSYIHYANYSNGMEQSIKAEYKNNENVYSTYLAKIAEVAQVPDMMKNDMKEVTVAALQGRYGQDGSKAVFQMLKEDNPHLEPSLYTKIQQIMESGRNDFREHQSKLIDIERDYDTIRGNVWSGFWIHLAGYPKIDLSQYQPINTDAADTAFKNHVDTPVKLR